MGRTKVLLATFATTVLVSGCHVFEMACPAIAQASGVSVTVAASYAPAVKALHLKACQDGVCREGDLELVPGSISVDQGCEPYIPEPGVPKSGVAEPGIPGQGVPGQGVPGQTAPKPGVAGQSAPEPAVPEPYVPEPGVPVPPVPVPPVPDPGGPGP